MRVERKHLINVGLVVLGVGVVVGIQLTQGVSTVQAKAEKDCICHAAGPPPTQYICIEPSVNAVTQNEKAGHLNEDASHGPEHAFDFLCEDCSECEKPGPEPTPEPTPSPK